ncbi:MAG: hypothetical protein IJ003_03615 [Candidatus Gastranaerophilales bacterium]|nr:hypothetical protein [Candidatus Gastranaerophilales bacterium]
MFDKNVILSARYIDFINKLDLLVRNLLFSDDGFIQLESKNAIDNYEKFIEKFDNEVLNLKKDIDFHNIDSVIQSKKEFFVDELNKHYKIQFEFWAMDVYQNFIQNSLILASISKDNDEKLFEIYNKAQEAINWISKIKKYNELQFKALILKFEEDFKSAISKQDSDYLNNATPKKDYKLFLKLRNLILDDLDEFNKLDLSAYKNKLDLKDINILTRYKSLLTTFRKTSLIDELKLVNSAILLQKFDDKQRYDFILQLEDDFNYFYSVNKKIDEKEKTILVKRRMEIFLNDIKKNLDYFKKLVVS